MRAGFTLTELMITVAIVAIVSVVGAITVNSRLQTARLEEAALTVAADLSYARTAAIFKNCLTRFVFCQDNLCSNFGSDTNLSNGTGESVSFETGADAEPARFYAIVRKSQYTEAGEECFNPGGTDPDVGSGSELVAFDYDRKPQRIGRGVAFEFIYRDVSDFNNEWVDGGGALLNEDSTEGQNALWFPVTRTDASADADGLTGLLNLPVDNPRDADGNFVVFQLQLDNCDPSDADDDCNAYFVTMDDAGETDVRKCVPGARTNNSNICF